MTLPVQIIRSLSFVFYFFLLAAGVAATIGMGVLLVCLKDLPKVPEPIGRIIETPPTEIYAATGERIMVVGGREAVPLNRVSKYFIEAVIATEDHRFYDHHGIDKLRTLKSFFITLFMPGKIQGASTITQQLSKNLFFSFKRSYLRKFQEMMVAFQIESRYNKYEILEAYVNQIAFGVGAYGIEQAARTFFGKPASELALAEAALLAGLPKSPIRYNPYLRFERAKRRQQIVLHRMVTVGYITPSEAARAASAELKLKPREAVAKTGSYFLDLVMKTLEEHYGPEAPYHGGLKVITTLDPLLQAQAQVALQNGLIKLDARLGLNQKDDAGNSGSPRPQGALVAVEARSGAVKALVGGRNYYQSEYNRAVQHNRQPGSGFKPFLYYAAFEKLGMTPATVMIDQAVRIPTTGTRDWVPRNFERDHKGPMILKRSFMESVNTIAAQLVEKTGPEEVIAIARRCGIKSHLAPVYSVALGTSGVSPLEMASAFATFATGGIKHEPFWIWRVEDAIGHVLEERMIGGKKVLDAGYTYQMIDIMSDALESGTGSIVRRKGFELPAAGKTGTSSDYKDAWFTGFTSTLSTSVWVGYDRERGLLDNKGRGITGGLGAAPIWADFMGKATEGAPRRTFTMPAGIRFEAVDPMTGCEATRHTTDPVVVALRKEQTLCNDTEPNKFRH